VLLLIIITKNIQQNNNIISYIYIYIYMNNVFYEHNIKEVDQTIFKNKLYFPRGRRSARTFTREHEKELMDWLEEVLEEEKKKREFSHLSAGFGKNTLYKGLKQEMGEKFDNEEDIDEEGGLYLPNDEYLDADDINEIIDKELSFLIKNILICTKEIIHNKIASNKNFIDVKILQCLGLSALILSIKVYLAYDWEENIYSFKELVNFTGNDKIGFVCTKKQLLDMEEDLLKTSNGIPCIKNQYNSEHLPGAWKGKEFMSNPHDYVEQYQTAEAKSKFFKAEAGDLISRHFSLLDNKNRKKLERQRNNSAAVGTGPGTCLGAGCGLGAAVKRKFTRKKGGRKLIKKRGRKHKRKTRKLKKKTSTKKTKHRKR